MLISVLLPYKENFSPINAGAVSLFVKDMKPRDWDIIPPMLLLSELGYFLTDLDFQPHQLNKSSLSHNGIIACRSLHQANAIRPLIEAYLNQ